MPLSNLAICVAIGGAVVASFGSYVRAKIGDNLTHKDSYRDAMSLAKAHPGTEHLFGKPVQFKGLDAANKTEKIYIIKPNGHSFTTGRLF